LSLNRKNYLFSWWEKVLRKGNYWNRRNAVANSHWGINVSATFLWHVLGQKC